MHIFRSLKRPLQKKIEIAEMTLLHSSYCGIFFFLFSCVGIGMRRHQTEIFFWILVLQDFSLPPFLFFSFRQFVSLPPPSVFPLVQRILMTALIKCINKTVRPSFSHKFSKEKKEKKFFRRGDLLLTQLMHFLKKVFFSVIFSFLTLVQQLGLYFLSFFLGN